MDIVFSSAAQLAAAIQAKQVSASEMLDAHLAQINAHNPTLTAPVSERGQRMWRWLTVRCGDRCMACPSH